MIKYFLLLLPLLGFASAIKVEHAELKPLGKMIKTNAQITQLSNQKQEIVSRLSGHLERYYVQAGEHVKSGEKVALVESIELSKMTAEYLALIQQEKAAQIQKNASMKLNQKGLSSQNDLSNAIIALEGIRSKQNALASQLKSLGLNPSNLTEATDKFIIYAHADGVVGEIITALHSNVNAQTLLMTLVNQSGYYATAYISTKHAQHVNKDTKGWIEIAGKNYEASFVQLLPHIDKETQRAKVLFSIKNNPDTLLLGTFTQMDISLAPFTKAVMVKKSALSLFQGEWVVFTEKEHEDTEHHEKKSDHNHEKEESLHDDHAHASHTTDKGHEEDEHEEHEEEASPYEANVVKIIAYVGDNIAIEGLKVDSEYVSDGVYFVKSMLLKSSLGEHGH